MSPGQARYSVSGLPFAQVTFFRGGIEEGRAPDGERAN